MFELACLLLVLVWLYFWLSGHWFARVIAFLAMLSASGVVGLVALLAMPSMPETGPWTKYQQSKAATGLPPGPPAKLSEGGQVVARLPDGTELQFPQGTADK